MTSAAGGDVITRGDVRPDDSKALEVVVTDTPQSSAPSARAHELHRAAVEWCLRRPLLIASEDDIESRDLWAKHGLVPRHHQVQNLMTFCRRAPAALLADDVGLGKTVSAGLIVAELIQRKRVQRVLVICPKALVAQWIAELKEKFGLHAVGESGKALRDVVASDEGIVVTTYHSARDHLDLDSAGTFDMVVLDEAHRLRRLHPHRPPMLAVKLRHLLAERAFKFVLMLTATPIQNRAWDLYSLIDYLTAAQGRRHPLGEPHEFSARFIEGPHDKGLKIKEGKQAELRTRIGEYITRLRRDATGLLFPSRNVVLRIVEPSVVEQQLAAFVRASLATNVGALEKVSLAQAAMSSPQALKRQLENSVANDDHTSRAIELRHVLQRVTALVDGGARAAKLLEVLKIVDELRAARPTDWRLVIFTTRVATQRTIAKELEQRGISHALIGGGRTARQDADALGAYTCVPPAASVLVSTDSGAEGLNMQAGNVLINYDLPWNPMILEQRIGRVQRMGSGHASVEIINLAVDRSVESTVVARLLQKLALIADAYGDVDSVLELLDDDGERFETTLGSIVVRSLEGADTSLSEARIEASIAAAEAEMEAGRALMDQTLAGEPSPLVVPAPRLPWRSPSMNAEEFVHAALNEEGFAIIRREAPWCDVDASDGTRRRVVIGPPPVESTQLRGVDVYAPDEPAFERLAEAWADRNGSWAQEYGPPSAVLLMAAARDWCAALGDVVVTGVQVLSSATEFRGRVDVVATAFVGHDRYESVVTLPVGAGEQAAPSPELGVAPTPLVGAVRAGDLIPTLEADVRRAVSEDEHVWAFTTHYSERLRVELAAAPPGPAFEARVRREFTPQVNARVAGVSGLRYPVVRTEVTVRVDDVAEYRMELTLVPHAREVRSHPTLGLCQKSGRSVPDEWLECCCATRRLVLRHFLVTSAKSAKRALPEHTVRCAATGRVLLLSETRSSSVSGISGGIDVMVASAISARVGLPNEVAACELTGIRVLIDELVVSAVSGRRFRVDQAVASDVGGATAHLSEMVRCSVSGDRVMPGEAGRSQVSGSIARLLFIASSDRPPHRIGLTTEVVRCARTGKRLLSDEVARCAASGLVVDASLLVKTARSPGQVLPEHTVICAITGNRLLVREVARCAVTRKIVDAQLLVPCAATGQKALGHELVRCEIIGWILPSELARCELTGSAVARRELRRCAVTGMLARRDRLLRCAVSNSFVTPDAAVRSDVSGKPVLPTEAVRLAWPPSAVLPSEAGRCALTGMQVALTVLNAAGEVDLLRGLLDGSRGEGAPDIAQWLRSLGGPLLGRVSSARTADGPQGDLVAVVADIKEYLGLRTRRIGFLARVDSKITPLGSACVGVVTMRGWVIRENLAVVES